MVGKNISLFLLLMVIGLAVLGCQPSTDGESKVEYVYVEPSPTPLKSILKIGRTIFLSEVADNLEGRKKEILELIVNPESLPPWREYWIGWRCLRTQVVGLNPTKLKFIERVPQELINQTCGGLLGFSAEELVEQ